MLIGHERLVKNFEQLIKDGRLSHSYIFFGESGVGKFSFALGLAAYLETGEFRESIRPLAETFIVRPDDEANIGITSIREVKYFLIQKPVHSSRRLVIINEAERLTSQAQHAILKVAEEPPPTGLIILIASNPEVLLPTIQSRLQKIYFPRVNPDIITALLTKQFKISKREAVEITKISFGRPGRAIQFLRDEEARAKRQKAMALLKKGSEKRKIIDELIETNMLEPFFTDIVAELSKDPIRNYKVLKEILNRATLISQFNTNKRLQLESALWSI